MCPCMYMFDEQFGRQQTTAAKISSFILVVVVVAVFLLLVRTLISKMDVLYDLFETMSGPDDYDKNVYAHNDDTPHHHQNNKKKMEMEMMLFAADVPFHSLKLIWVLKIYIIGSKNLFLDPLHAGKFGEDSYDAYRRSAQKFIFHFIFWGVGKRETKNPKEPDGNQMCMNLDAVLLLSTSRLGYLHNYMD